MKEIIKKIVRIFFKLINFNLLFSLFQRLSYFASQLVYFKDWVVMVNGPPQYFNHQLNIYKWIYEPNKWAFTARGVYAREKMFPGCTVLDLCCGDGSYSYLFFSDIAGAIDAVDIDQTAISHALRFYSSSPKIKYHKLDIVNDNFPSTGYDFVVWNAAISYFDIVSIHKILKKIVTAGNAGIQLCGVTPIANDNKTAFNDAAELKELLLQYFTDVQIKQIDEITVKNLYFQATAPL